MFSEKLKIMARIYTKFKTVPSRARLRKAAYWLLPLAGLALLGWLTWPTTKPPPSRTVPPATPSVKTNLLLVPAVRTNRTSIDRKSVV